VVFLGIFKSKPLHFREEGVLIFHFLFVDYTPPAAFRVFQKSVNIDIAHQVLSDNGHHIRERPFAFHLAFDKCQ
jgi:hypothetical protein